MRCLRVCEHQDGQFGSDVETATCIGQQIRPIASFVGERHTRGGDHSLIGEHKDLHGSGRSEEPDSKSDTEPSCRIEHRREGRAEDRGNGGTGTHEEGHASR
jgi:hypothetical protein